MPDGQVLTFRPQAGPQEDFLASSADIAIMGGSAGGGKSYALLMEPIRHRSVTGFTAAIFRRNMVDLRKPGGLWSESQTMYRAAGASPRESPKLEWRFPSSATVEFAHLEHDKTTYSWHGAQVCFLGFDELTSFSAHQFWYLLSRNRSACGIRPYIRATTNPDADSWVAKFLEWWIDQETGYAIPERSGKLRWFVRLGETLMWADHPSELAHHVDNHGDPIPPKSVTFVPASLDDNKELMKLDPGYRANLMALSTVERERLLHGNWKIRPAAGLYFQRHWCNVVEARPTDGKWMWARGWDLAATEEREGTDPDWTTGTLIGINLETQRLCIADHRFDRVSPHRVDQMLQSVAADDGRNVIQALPQDPGQAGKYQRQRFATLLHGYNVRFRRMSKTTGSKIERFAPFSAQAEAGNVDVVRGPWNDRLFTELEKFPPDTDSGHDDDADSVSEAYAALTQKRSKAGVGHYRRAH